MPQPSPPLALTRRTCATRSEPLGRSFTCDRACSPGAACRLCMALQRTAWTPGQGVLNERRLGAFMDPLARTRFWLLHHTFG